MLTRDICLPPVRLYREYGKHEYACSDPMNRSNLLTTPLRRQLTLACQCYLLSKASGELFRITLGPTPRKSLPRAIVADEAKGMDMRKLKTLLRDKKGATAIEYGLIAGLIAVVIIAAVGLIGANLSNEEGTGDGGTDKEAVAG